jgi:hypothetical protein
MIHLTIESNTPVAINPRQVLFVKEAPTSGCVIVFDNETRLHVRNSYLDVVGQIAAANNT